MAVAAAVETVVAVVETDQKQWVLCNPGWLNNIGVTTLKVSWGYLDVSYTNIILDLDMENYLHHIVLCKI